MNAEQQALAEARQRFLRNQSRPVEWLTVPQISDETGLNIHRNTWYRIIASGDLRSVKVGRAIRVQRAWLEDYLNGGVGS